jgi:hypothetical protein
MSEADPQDSSHATIVHRTRGRIRLRVPSRRGNRRWFRQLEHVLSAVPAIEDALANPRTASILLNFAEGDADAVIETLYGLEQLSLSADQPPTPGEPAPNPAKKQPDDAAGNWPGPDELRTLVKLLVVGLLIRELWQGRWLVPGVFVLWLGSETLRRQLDWLPDGKRSGRTSP